MELVALGLDKTVKNDLPTAFRNPLGFLDESVGCHGHLGVFAAVFAC